MPSIRPGAGCRVDQILAECAPRSACSPRGVEPLSSTSRTSSAACRRLLQLAGRGTRGRRLQRLREHGVFAAPSHSASRFHPVAGRQSKALDAFVDFRGRPRRERAAAPAASADERRHPGATVRDEKFSIATWNVNPLRCAANNSCSGWPPCSPTVALRNQECRTGLHIRSSRRGYHSVFSGQRPIRRACCRAADDGFHPDILTDDPPAASWPRPLPLPRHQPVRAQRPAPGRKNLPQTRG